MIIWRCGRFASSGSNRSSVMRGRCAVGSRPRRPLGLAGAETILKLRAIKTNCDFDAYWRYHL